MEEGRVEESGGRVGTTCEDLGTEMVWTNDTWICDHIMMGWRQGVMITIQPT